MCSATEPASVTTPADELYRLPLAADVAQRPLRRCSNAWGGVQVVQLVTECGLAPDPKTIVSRIGQSSAMSPFPFHCLDCLMSSLMRSPATRRHTRCQSFLVKWVPASQSCKHCASQSAPRLRICSGVSRVLGFNLAPSGDGCSSWDRIEVAPPITSSESVQTKSSVRTRRLRMEKIHGHRCRDQSGKLPKIADWAP
jgi:hypothetical protein